MGNNSHLGKLFRAFMLAVFVALLVVTGVGQAIVNAVGLVLLIALGYFVGRFAIFAFGLLLLMAEEKSNKQNQMIIDGEIVEEEDLLAIEFIDELQKRRNLGFRYEIPRDEEQ